MTTSSMPNRLSNGHQTAIANDDKEEDQLNRINLQALQNRDPYISKIVDQAQRVCVYKFIADKREWERKELEGTLFVYERICEPYHGFVILSTVSRETFVQIIKPTMEFKHTPTYEAFLQYKVDVGDIYGIWFISKNDCPRVTECLKRLTEKAKEGEQSKLTGNAPSASSPQQSNNIISLLNNAQDKFQESKRKQDVNNSDASSAMPAILLRLFSTQDSTAQATMNSEERGEELKITLGISGKPALRVTELEKQLLQPSTSSQPTEKSLSNNESLAKPVPVATRSQIQPTTQSIASHVPTHPHSVTMNSNLYTGRDSIATNNNHLMTPAEFQTLRIAPSPVIPTQVESSSSCAHCQHQPLSSTNSFSRDHLRQLLVDMLQHDEDFLTGLYNAYLERQTIFHRLY